MPLAPEDVSSAIESTVDKFGGLNGAVNAAGVAIAQKTVSSRGVHPLDAFRKVRYCCDTATEVLG